MKKVLIIDDNIDILRVLKKQLKGYDVKCYTKMIPMEFVAQYDLVILDRKLKNKDGLEIACEIRAILPEQKIIMITGFVDLFEGNLEGPFDKILIKPISKKLLINSIEEVCDG
ncbi:MAG: response regulator [Mycoplasma sp.]|nr:response regulator [Mycoplasma sp.]